MMKQPTEDDFAVVEVLESGVTVLFEPTQSYYTFYRLAESGIRTCFSCAVMSRPGEMVEIP
jgi:hypothetical protein